MMPDSFQSIEDFKKDQIRCIDLEVKKLDEELRELKDKIKMIEDTLIKFSELRKSYL